MLDLELIVVPEGSEDPPTDLDVQGLDASLMQSYEPI